ncbi:PAS domain S-box protein [Psychrosphaera sp. F3M07]|uniref:sensor histidine kinase n=1 Tax=Psychrosphaera sp. F3M07 TaxID=2841560 RepID=UPI001C085CE0|nr:ATP-binding protein [Psychrosphaera sp. F3M07]MBU2916667.1 PAS domain S-box protein [Psychrosphaera sp. F3M07]
MLKNILHGSLILTFLIFVSSLVAGQFIHQDVINVNTYQTINLMKGLICISVFLYWLFIRFSRVAQSLFNLFKAWQTGVVFLLQGIDGLLIFFIPDQSYRVVIVCFNLVATSFLYIHLYFTFLSKRLSDLVVISLLAAGFFLFIGYAYQWNGHGWNTSVLFNDVQPILLILSAVSCSLLLAIALMRIQYKLKQYSEFELMPLLILFSGFLTLIAGDNLVIWSSAVLLHMFFVGTVISLIVKVDKHFAADWMLLSTGLNTSTNAYFYYDQTGEIHFVNQAFKKLFGIKEDTPLNQIKHPLHSHPLFETISNSLSQQGYWSGETVIVGDNGNVISVHVDFNVIVINDVSYYQAWFLDLAEKIALRTNEHAIQEKLERLSFNLMDKQEEERRYFAKELHDEIGQGLTLLKIQQQLPEPDKELIKSVLSELIDKVRNLSLNLRPSILDDMGLSAALEWLTDRQRKFSQLAIVSDISSNLPRFNDKFEISVFRIAQEAFTNIHKYSHADLVNIHCSIQDDYLQLTIEDNGIGFDVGSKLNSAIKGQSLGLLSIQERAFLINGLIEISSTPENGTLIELRVPVFDNALDETPFETEGGNGLL